MDLQDLKNEWDAVNSKNSASLSTNRIMDAITQKEYTIMIKKIKYAEWAGSLVCVCAAGYVLFNFGKLDAMYLQGIGIITVLLLLLMPVIGLLSLQRLNVSHNTGMPHTQALKQFALQKIQFWKLQRLNFLLGFLLLVATVVLLPVLVNGKNITKDNYYWVLAFPIGYLFKLFAERLAKRYYKHSLQQAETLLKEIETDNAML